MRVSVDDAVAQLAGRDHLRQPRPLDLAARGLRNRGGLHYEHARGPVADGAVHPVHDLAAERRPAAVGWRRRIARLGDDVEALRAGSLAVDADGRGVADAGQLIDGLLDVGGQQVAAAEDDEIFESPRDVEKALVVEKAQVTR